MKATHPQLKKRLINNGYRTTVVRKLILSLLLLLLLPLMLLLHWRQQHVLLLTGNDRTGRHIHILAGFATSNSQLATRNSTPATCDAIKNGQQSCDASLNQVLRLIRHDNYTRVLPMLLVAIMP